MTARIKTVPPEEANGKLAELYEKMGKNMANILRVHSLNPPSLESHYAWYRSIMYGPSPLSRSEREMIATAVAAANDCQY